MDIEPNSIVIAGAVAGTLVTVQLNPDGTVQWFKAVVQSDNEAGSLARTQIRPEPFKESTTVYSIRENLNLNDTTTFFEVTKRGRGPYEGASQGRFRTRDDALSWIKKRYELDSRIDREEVIPPSYFSEES